MTEAPKNEETSETPDEAAEAAETAAEIAEQAAADAEQADTAQEAAEAAATAAEAASVSAKAAAVAQQADADEGLDADAEAVADEVATEAAAPAKKRGLRRGSAEAGAQKQRSRRRRPEAEQVFVRAQAKYVRSSPRKARLVIDHIRGKSVEEARAILSHTPRAAAVPVLKVLESAIANAEHNHELLPEELRIHQVMVDEGPTIKRYRPRALGRATKIRKRTSHITINLTNKA
jgi:ribosomal protein L22